MRFRETPKQTECLMRNSQRSRHLGVKLSEHDVLQSLLLASVHGWAPFMAVLFLQILMYAGDVVKRLTVVELMIDSAAIRIAA